MSTLKSLTCSSWWDTNQKHSNARFYEGKLGVRTSSDTRLLWFLGTALLGKLIIMIGYKFQKHRQCKILLRQTWSRSFFWHRIAVISWDCFVWMHLPEFWNKWKSNAMQDVIGNWSWIGINSGTITMTSWDCLVLNPSHARSPGTISTEERCWSKFEIKHKAELNMCPECYHI